MQPKPEQNEEFSFRDNSRVNLNPELSKSQFIELKELPRVNSLGLNDDKEEEDNIPIP